MGIIKHVWEIIDKYKGKYPHTRERARRKRQVERGILTRANGLRE